MTDLASLEDSMKHKTHENLDDNNNQNNNNNEESDSDDEIGPVPIPKEEKMINRKKKRSKYSLCFP
jgi:hypothetical protein